MNTSNPNTNFSTKQPASKHVAHTKKSNHIADLTSRSKTTYLHIEASNINWNQQM